MTPLETAFIPIGVALGWAIVAWIRAEVAIMRLKTKQDKVTPL